MFARRKPSTRYRGEPPPKRRRSTTSPPPAHNETSPNTILVDDNSSSKPIARPDGLVRKSDSHIPTSLVPLAGDLPSTHYQGIHERSDEPLICDFDY
jgi:hypothetical protein